MKGGCVQSTGVESTNQLILWVGFTLLLTFLTKRCVAYTFQMVSELIITLSDLLFCPYNLLHLTALYKQGRLFSYSDTQRYRLGPNYLQFPVNHPFKTKITNYQRDGPQTYTNNQGGAPNYFPNSFSGPKNDPSAAISTFNVTGDVARYLNNKIYYSL